MSHIASAVRRLVGEGASFPSMRALARAAGMEPSNLTRLCRGAAIKPPNLQKLLAVLNEEDRTLLEAAALQDTLPLESSQKWIQPSTRPEVPIPVSTISPKAQKTLRWLEEQAAADPRVEAWIEQLGSWVAQNAH